MTITRNGSGRTQDNPLVGIISDTHGLLRPKALSELQGCDLIIHAGDIGRESILAALEEIAPVVAVRGNVDHGDWADKLPMTIEVIFHKWRIYVLHNYYELDINPVEEGYHAVISGHSHRPEHEERDGVLYFNPGSAGPRRFMLPVSVGRLRAANTALRGEIVIL